jgi:phosphatidate cytidylyltransferase
MFCAVIGMIGDLSASLIKRQNDIKDFGKIMPGHGGLMDRFDSVLLCSSFMANSR